MKLEIIQSRALEKSIIKWEKIVDRTGTDKGRGNCELCQKFNDCIGCPVQIRVGDIGCNETPYINWKNHYHGKRGARLKQKVQCPECKRLAIKELEFLKSLR